MVCDKVILLVEDNSGDEILTLRTLKKNNIDNKVIVAHDGAEALDYLFGKGIYSGRDTRIMPQVILFDLTLPRVDGFSVSRKDRMNDRTKRLPVVILTSSGEQQDTVSGYAFGSQQLRPKASRIRELRQRSQPSGNVLAAPQSDLAHFAASLNGLARSRPDRCQDQRRHSHL